MIRKARMEDVKKIHKLLDIYGRGLVIPRSLSELYEHIRDFYVCIEDDNVVGTAALNITWDNLAEIRTVIVADEYKGKGFGRILVEACLKDAKSLDIYNVFVLTYSPNFFKKFGFKKVAKSKLPHKIWGDCIKCAKFPDCDEIAMLCKLQETL